MTKEQINNFRKKYEGCPLIVIIDNEHNFFVNYPGQPQPVWDDASETVTFLQMHIESSGGPNTEWPYTLTVTSYEHIQQIKAMLTREQIVKYIDEHRAKLGDDVSDYNMSVVKNSFRNTRPEHPPYYNN